MDLFKKLMDFATEGKYCTRCGTFMGPASRPGLCSGCREEIKLSQRHEVDITFREERDRKK